MAVVPSALFLFLLLFSFSDISLAQYSNRVLNCTPVDQLDSVVGEYSYSGNPSVPLCPLTSNAGGDARWLFELPQAAEVYSETAFPPEQICVGSRASFNNSYLFFLKPFIINNPKGNLSFEIRSVSGDTYLEVLFAPQGVFLIPPPSNILRVTEGEPVDVKFVFLVYHDPNLVVGTPDFYKTTGGGFVNPNTSAISVDDFPNIDKYCHQGSQRPQYFGIMVRNPSVDDSGNYSVVALIGNTNYTANFTIIVSPIETTTSSSTMMDSSSIIMSPSVTPSATIIIPTSTSPTMSNSMSTSPTPEGISLILYSVFGLLVFVGLAVCILLVILSVLCFRKIRKRRGTSGPPNSPNTITYFNEEAKIQGEKPDDSFYDRSGSTSSTKPIIHSGRHSSTSSGQSTRQEDYTAVYCGERQAHIGKMWREKYEDKCVIHDNDDEILASLENPSCREVFMHADPQDPVFKAVMSRGSPRNREKLKWWHIVDKDKTPNHLIEAEGFKIVQVEGDSSSFDTLQLGMMKTENPTLNHTTAVIEETNSNGYITTRSHNISYHTGTEKRPIDETDGVTTSTPNGRDPIIKELLEEQKKTNEFLAKIHGTSEKQLETSLENTEANKGVLRIQEDLVEDTASSGIKDTTV